MIVSWNWLAQYVRLDMPVENLTKRLALAGLNHESTSEVGGDLAIDLEVTSNRPDCLGHIGVAREIAVLYDRRAAFPDPRPATSGLPVATRAAVAVECDDLCPRFTARVLSGVKVGESPWWLRKRLETIGVRPISNIVDATNYVMFECGQPLHAYDLDRLDGSQLIVRRARGGETLRAINNKIYELGPEMVVIADATRPVGLAGVMGGLETEIGPGSVNVLIESARFDPSSVRKTARVLRLHSPSSYRFERPLDPEGTEWASRRCAELILEVAGGTLHPGLLDRGGPPPSRPVVSLRAGQVERILGIPVPEDRCRAILRALGLEEVATRTDGAEDGRRTYRPPSWRSDLGREIDLIEEVGRIYGYERIPEDRPVPLVSAARSARERVEAEIRGALTACGFDEAVTFSLVPDALAVALERGGADREPIRVEHAGWKGENALRRSLLPSLLAVRRRNEAHGQVDADLFEIANVYLPREEGGLPDERTRLSMVSGRGFFELKGAVEALLERLHVGADFVVRPASVPLLAPGRSAELLLGSRRLGVIGEVHRPDLEALELRGDCTAAELELSALLEEANPVPQHRHLPAFPIVARDLSLVVPRHLPWADLAEVVRRAAGADLESVAYLDTFQGGNLPESAQSIHFGLRFRHRDRTLTGDEVERSVRDVVEACATRFGATLRQ